MTPRQSWQRSAIFPHRRANSNYLFGSKQRERPKWKGIYFNMIKSTTVGNLWDGKRDYSEQLPQLEN